MQEADETVVQSSMHVLCCVFLLDRIHAHTTERGLVQEETTGAQLVVY